MTRKNKHPTMKQKIKRIILWKVILILIKKYINIPIIQISFINIALQEL